MSKHVLITGGAGFIGQHTARQALATGWKVTVLDDLSTGKFDAIARLDLRFIEGDIRDASAVASALEGVTHVMHLAAKISVPESCERPVEYDSVNCGGFIQVLQAATNAGCQRLAYASSAAVYGSVPTSPKRITDRPQPESPYAVQKRANELYAMAWTGLGRLETIGLRYFNVFGPGQDPNGPYGAVIPAFVEAAVAGKTLHIHGDGQQTRDFVSVRDVARANLAALEARGAAGQVHNIGGGRGLSINELADLIDQVVGSTRRVHTDPRPGDVRQSLASIEDTRQALGWAPSEPFLDALAETIESFR